MKSALDLPRYKENPIYLFFESYIIDTIRKLPKERYDQIQEMNLKGVFNTNSENWKDVITEVLNLSNTIDIAILDLWYRNKDNYDDNELGYQAYSQDFTDHYMANDSKVDVWPDGALDAAKQRIKIAEQESSGNGC